MDAKYIELVEQLLSGRDAAYEIKRTYKSYKKEDETTGNTRYTSIDRVISSYEQYKSTSKALKDLLANLRQFNLIFKGSIKITNSFYERIKNYEGQFGIRISLGQAGRELWFENDYPDWLEMGEEAKSLYNYTQLEKEKVLGDPYLYQATRYKEYTSKAQKYIVHQVLNQQEGTTILGALRTGGGKSLVFQIPAFYEKRGVTVVIVPTIALAIDQETSAQNIFREREVRPRAIHSEVSLAERKEILEQLHTGTMPLLYTSPEVMLSKWFKEELYKLAQEGLINRLVIDEAHIVDEWGDFFRVDFQLLSILRRKLVALSNNKFKTVLLSATLSQDTTQILKNQFSEEGRFIEIRTDALRQEIMYYYRHCNSYEDRKERFKQLLAVLPRPFIAYVGTREDAQMYGDLIKKAGFQRVTTFTGEDTAKKRKEIIEQWKNHELDIIVATCAFGVGVDKKDVRAVVHLYMPPSIDRFYQEVGRGGRDGFAALSISLIFHSKDFELIGNLTSKKVLKPETIVKRWKAMVEDNIGEQGSNELIVNVSVNPNDTEFAGNTNANWNAYVTLFLYRNGLLDILDLALQEDGRYQFHIRIKDNILDDTEENMIQVVERYRELERKRVDEQIEQVKAIMRADNDTCWGEYFREVYPFTERCCRSCPTCRSQEEESIFNASHIEIYDGRKQLLEYLKNRALNLSELDLKERLFELAGEIEAFDFSCIKENEIDVLVLPRKELLDLQGIQENRFFEAYEYEEILGEEDRILRGRICIVFESGNRLNDEIYKYFHRKKGKYTETRYLYVAPRGFKINAYNKELVQLIDGSVIRIN